MTPGWVLWVIVGGPLVGALAGAVAMWAWMLHRLDRIRDDIWQDGFDQGRYNLAGESVEVPPAETVLISLHPHQPKHGAAPVATLSEWTEAAMTGIRQEFWEIRNAVLDGQLSDGQPAPWPGFPDAPELDHRMGA